MSMQDAVHQGVEGGFVSQLHRQAFTLEIFPRRRPLAPVPDSVGDCRTATAVDAHLHFHSPGNLLLCRRMRGPFLKDEVAYNETRFARPPFPNARSIALAARR